MNTYGNKIRLTLFGSSHSEELGCVLSGLPAGKRIVMNSVLRMLSRRAAANGGPGATLRIESDLPQIKSGLVSNGENGVLVTDGNPIEAVFRNRNIRKSDYGHIARPSHADYATFKKTGALPESGGGMASGRMTLPITFAGAVCAEALKERGITVLAHVLRIGDVWDRRFDPMAPALDPKADPYFPLADSSVLPAMLNSIELAGAAGDTLSCECECAILGVPAGVGEPFFNGVESMLSHLLFSIPGIRGVEFGEREHIMGSQMNDQFKDDGLTVTNRSGGVNGGMANGMPIVFRAWFRPVPSVGIEQTGYDMEADRPAPLSITGRHDTCILPRGLAAVEAAASLCILDLMEMNDER